MSILNIPNLSKWMTLLSDTSRLSNLSIPGTHDTCAFYNGWSFGFAQTQTETLEWQLNNGIRYLDIRCKNLEFFNVQEPGMFLIYHGVIREDMTFDNVLDICFTFLSKNPGETIIMHVQQESSTDSDLYKRIFANYLNTYGRNKFYLGNHIPLLNEVRGKIVLLTGLPWIEEGIINGNMNISDDYSNPQVAEKQKKTSEHIYQSTGNNDTYNKLYITFFSANGAGYSLWTPWSYAQVMNPFILSLVQDHPVISKSTQLGIIVFDYAGSNGSVWNAHSNVLMKAIIARNNFPTPP